MTLAVLLANPLVLKLLLLVLTALLTWATKKFHDWVNADSTLKQSTHAQNVLNRAGDVVDQSVANVAQTVVDKARRPDGSLDPAIAEQAAAQAGRQALATIAADPQFLSDLEGMVGDVASWLRTRSELSVRTDKVSQAASTSFATAQKKVGL